MYNYQVGSGCGCNTCEERKCGCNECDTCAVNIPPVVYVPDPNPFKPCDTLGVLSVDPCTRVVNFTDKCHTDELTSGQLGGIISLGELRNVCSEADNPEPCSILMAMPRACAPCSPVCEDPNHNKGEDCPTDSVCNPCDPPVPQDPVITFKKVEDVIKVDYAGDPCAGEDVADSIVCSDDREYVKVLTDMNIGSDGDCCQISFTQKNVKINSPKSSGWAQVLDSDFTKDIDAAAYYGTCQWDTPLNLAQRFPEVFGKYRLRVEWKANYIVMIPDAGFVAHGHPNYTGLVKAFGNQHTGDDILERWSYTGGTTAYPWGSAGSTLTGWVDLDKGEDAFVRTKTLFRTNSSFSKNDFWSGIAHNPIDGQRVPDSAGIDDGLYYMSKLWGLQISYTILPDDNETDAFGEFAAQPGQANPNVT